ncbi:MAG: hypothetical protein PHV02_07255 [Rhodocyclaceae bacterium]|nr:hypothetical protein [Rhodocyclaceae bacterium]
MSSTTEGIRKAFLDAVYDDLDDLERQELALGLICLRVHKINLTAEFVNQDEYLADEYRFEYFGRTDIEDQYRIPSGFRELAQCSDPKLIIELSAMVLNAIEDFVDRNFPGTYQTTFGGHFG